MFIKWKTTGSQNNFWIIIRRKTTTRTTTEETTRRYDSLDRNRPPWPKFVMEYSDYDEISNDLLIGSVAIHYGSTSSLSPYLVL
jgi:hypothetical protein